jgi:hypothetical protein
VSPTRRPRFDDPGSRVLSGAEFLTLGDMIAGDHDDLAQDHRPRTAMPPTFQLTFDCASPDRLADFWSQALGYQLQPPPPGFESWPAFLTAQSVPTSEWDRASAIVDPDGIRPRIYFQRVPEKKTAKNRLHLDVNVGGGQEVPVEERKVRVLSEVERLKTLGATDERGAIDENGEFWVRLNDPEGNEFCLQ